MEKKVFKKVLDNGLTVLVMPNKIVPTVSTQLWYNVGSKDEVSGQKGIAHLIEHMIFKGTATLSECDINLITHKLSGYCNAFTSYDYTGYLFDFPSQNWHEALPIYADCMKNCTFKQDFLNSELKAVVQELKMYKDDYISSLLEQLVSSIFFDHPYHHPVIGYKQDLWNLNNQTLIEFYEQHYIPNNATLVVVGDVDPENVFDLAQKNFGHILPNWNYKKPELYHSIDLKNYEVTLFRQVNQPVVILSWLIDGAKKGQEYLVDIVSSVLSNGKGSRLYKKLVDDLELVTEIESFNYDLFDYGLFFIYFRPKKVDDIEKIIDIISKELERLQKEGTDNQELLRAIKRAEIDNLSVRESNQRQAYEIGKFFLATGDEQFIYTYTDYPKDNLNEKVKNFVSKFLQPVFMNKGKILPVAEDQKKYWSKVQDISDNEDKRILSQITRTAEIEEGKCVYSIEVNPPEPFNYPKAQAVYVNNDLKVLYYNNHHLPKIDLILDFKAKYYYDPENLQGLSSFVAHLLEEGTKNYTATEFSDTLESYGMDLYSGSGRLSLSMLSVDFAKGLELLNEMLTQALFNDKAIERVREQMLANLSEYWDSPSKFVIQLVKENIYKDHPYSKNKLGTVESIKSITKEDILDYYNKFLSPKAARLAVVGDLERYDTKDCISHMLDSWQGSRVETLDFPELTQVNHKEVNYPIMRDQVVLCYGGLSVKRTDADYDKLLLFDQIFTGGVLGSMSSRLFDLRERTGLFYTISGSLLSHVDHQNGMVLVKTIVSNDRLAEAEKAIENVINTAIDNVSQVEFDEAKRAIVNSLVENFSSNYKIAATSLFKDNYDFPTDYFDQRAEQLSKISIKEMQEAVKKYLNTDKMVKVRAGRV